jgi:hypothetical protein
MGIERLPGTDIHYYLIAFDENGVERENAQVSAQLVNLLQQCEITDVFMTIHGWKADLAAARAQYRSWIGAMLECTADIKRAKKRSPDFKPLIIGFHWPSLPWGDEEMSISALAFDTLGDSKQAWISEAAAKTADTAVTRQALGVLFDAALTNPNPPMLPPEIINAYNALHTEVFGSSSNDIGVDRDLFDPEKAYQSQRQEPLDYGGITGSALFAPLVQLSFWKMKKRAQVIGEGAGARLIAQLQQACVTKPARFHLMGHSFGCIVASSMLIFETGQPATCADSLVLVQGALSLWSYAAHVPHKPELSGYFHPILAEHRVRGAIITTRSEHDTAVGKLYPLAAGLAGPAAYDGLALPKYGALGAFGARGEGIESTEMTIEDVHHSYAFKSHTLYNLECSKVIKNGTGLSGAHNDIAHAQLAHVVWEAVIQSMG